MTSTIKPPTDAAMTPCGDCGMPCDPREYHPYAACLMFKSCHNSKVVRANLNAVRGAPSPAGEPVAWGIFDSQGFYEAAVDQESAERFCAHYNKRKGADPLKPYTCAPLYAAPPTKPEAVREPLTESEMAEGWRKFQEQLELRMAADPGGLRSMGRDHWLSWAHWKAACFFARGITQKEGGQQ